jgi:hypothetical protein
MKKIILCLLLTSANPHIKAQTMTGSDTKDKIIFAVGGEFSKEYLQYVIGLTKKQQPKICFLPTAAADNPYAINYWYELCLGLRLYLVCNAFLLTLPRDRRALKRIY